MGTTCQAISKAGAWHAEQRIISISQGFSFVCFALHVKQQVACRQSFYTLFTSTTPPAKSSTYGNREFYWSSSEWVRVFLPIYESEKGTKALPLLCCEKDSSNNKELKDLSLRAYLLPPSRCCLLLWVTIAVTPSICLVRKLVRDRC